MVLGIVVGIFFGEYCAFLKILGDAFIKLLQITILPYITISLILGIGGLTPDQAKIMARKAGLLILVFWGISFVMVLLLPLSFPQWESAAFFSSSILEMPKKVDFLDLYIPSNPFSSLANNVVPAVVLFSILLGIALMGMKNKGTLLMALETASKALIRVTNLVVNLTPIGLFAIMASTAGTMTVGEFGRLQVYLVSYNIAAVILTFWILPMLVTPFTPFKYKDIIGLTRDSLMTAFTTGNLFVVLTVLTENCKDLFQKYKLQDEKTDTYVDVIVPISFNFPNTGKLLMLLFILFAAWFTGVTFSLAQYPTFVFAGLLSFFGGVDVAMPFMLDLLRIPADMYQLYVATGVINGRFATLLAAMNLVIFTLLATASLTGVLSLNKKKLAGYVVTSLLLTIGVIAATRGYYSIAVNNNYTKDKVLTQMQSAVFPVPREVFKPGDSIPEPSSTDLPVLQRIRESGILRVGYYPLNIPFSYFSVTGELVGFDVDMAQLLASEMNVELQFIPIKNDELADKLEAAWIDVAMSGIPVTTPRMEVMAFSEPYLETALCFIVPDHRRSEFVSAKTLKSIPELKIATVAGDYFTEKLKGYLPQAQIIKLESYKDFFNSQEGLYDALLYDAERGSALTLLYPAFQPVVPLPDINRQPLAYPVASHDREFAIFLSQWINLKKGGIKYKQLYNHWILGEDAVPDVPRWSIIRDVFKWVN